jgi:ribonuclease P/MRP protein subunit POP8
MESNMATEAQTTQLSKTEAVQQTAETTENEAIIQQNDNTTPPLIKPRPNASQTHHTATLRSPSWTYFHISLFTLQPLPPPSQTPLDALTARRHITSAFQRTFGLTGEAMPVDILKLDGDEVWIRVPIEDAVAVHESLSSWVGTEMGGQRWVVKGRDEWLVRLVAGDGADLFR